MKAETDKAMEASLKELEAFAAAVEAPPADEDPEETAANAAAREREEAIVTEQMCVETPCCFLLSVPFC